MTKFMTRGFLSLAFAFFIFSSCQTDGSDGRFSRAERAFKHSGPMGVVAIYMADARKGDARAAFYVGTAYCVEAALQRKKYAPKGDIRKLEGLALEFYRLAERGGDEEARIMLNEVRKNGRSALYFISIEHLFNQEDPRVTHPDKFYRLIKR